MSLPSVDIFANNIKSIPPCIIPIIGITKFVQVLANFMDQVQATGGSPGIFTLNQPVLLAGLLLMRPVANNSWIEPFANIMAAAITASVITPGTVVNPAWIGSGFLDTNTSPSAASTIINIPAAKAQLIADLQLVTAKNNPPRPLAQAISDATLTFIFLCIGLGAPPVFPPIPIPLAAQ